MRDEELLEAARAAASRAYSPYSKLEIGAAVLARDGRVSTGANVENASYGLSLCAERAALAGALAAGVLPGEIEALAVTASPCGACRQWLLELCVERVVYDRDGELAVTTPSRLLPHAFQLPR
jgi:cytidine deaminase